MTDDNGNVWVVNIYECGVAGSGKRWNKNYGRIGKLSLARPGKAPWPSVTSDEYIVTYDDGSSNSFSAVGGFRGCLRFATPEEIGKQAW